MTTMRADRDRSSYWPLLTRACPPSPFARTLAAFLVDQLPVSAVGRPDATVLTHTRVRCTGPRGAGVHRLDSARGRLFYTTGCGMRVAKDAGTLTAADVDCEHHGCKAVDRG